jgi:phosphoribosylanthranilate isomerase
MKDPENLEQLCDLSPEFVGFIFYPNSKRFVGRSPDPALFQIPGPAIKKVGVFVNQEISQVRSAVNKFGLDMVQLHGGERVDYCRNLAGEGVQVIKAIDPRKRLDAIESYSSVVDFFLFDSAGEGRGGTGRKFDWDLLQHLNMQVPYLLSGGIGPGDAEILRRTSLTGMTGIDINSRFELSPGIKDIEILKKFINELRK